MVEFERLHLLEEQEDKGKEDVGDRGREKESVQVNVLAARMTKDNAV